MKIDIKNYNIESYKNDIKKYGLSLVWDSLLDLILNKKEENIVFNVENFGELYEIGLEELDKKSKKELGKYYTPIDVSLVMSEWFDKLDGKRICDVGCGTGNLILSYFDFIGKEKTRKIILEKNLYLYDMDSVALKICQYAIAIKFGKDLLNKINVCVGDFLAKEILLPHNCKVISNPPYFKISNISEKWELTQVIMDTKELYSAFIEKIIDNSKSSVIISPYSFLGGKKFFSLRKKLDIHNGFIVSFDNVPGSIFNGRKHGIFNTNFSNSVRAAITVVENKPKIRGFKVSPLIRFKTIERKQLLNSAILEGLLNTNYQRISEKNRNYYKCFKELDDVYNMWIKHSNKEMSDIISNKEEKYVLYVPKTCRYFVTASSISLNRDGKYILYFDSIDKFYYAYALINSSFVYWHWRLYDGGITYPISLLLRCPIFIDNQQQTQKEELIKIVDEMIEKEKKYFVYKKNANKFQENIKFPKRYRDKLNRVLYDILEIDESMGLINMIHSNSIFDLKEDNDGKR